LLSVNRPEARTAIALTSISTVVEEGVETFSGAERAEAVAASDLISGVLQKRRGVNPPQR
jgi:hypothetical protein